MSGDLHCIARRRGIIVGLLDGLELLLFKLLLLSRLGDACTVILCWKSVRKQNKSVLMFWIKNFSEEHAAILLKTKLYNELDFIICNLFIQLRDMHIKKNQNKPLKNSKYNNEDFESNRQDFTPSCDSLTRTWTTASWYKWPWSTHLHHKLLFSLFGCHRRDKKYPSVFNLKWINSQGNEICLIFLKHVIHIEY